MLRSNFGDRGLTGFLSLSLANTCDFSPPVETVHLVWQFRVFLSFGLDLYGLLLLQFENITSTKRREYYLYKTYHVRDRSSLYIWSNLTTG